MNPERSRRLYRLNAPIYDLVARAFAGIRTAALSKLAPRPGEIILDLACGTGLSFDLIEAGIGQEGLIIGVDQSPEMLDRARRRVVRWRWSNVRLVECNAVSLMLPPGSVDAVLCCLAHDVASSREALGAAVSALKEGGRFVSAGIRLAAGPVGFLANPIARAISQAAVTAPLTATPWRVLQDALGGLAVTELRLGTAYVAVGVKPGRVAET